MSGKRGQKATLLDWANDQNQLERTAKSTLKELASYADADCCAWAKVATLAYGVNASERTIQYHLRALQEAGLIRDTGRLHRLEGSTRSVPVYQLAPDVDGLGKAQPMGAEIAPIPGHGCKTSGAMGATGLHPQETIGDHEVADATSPGAGARAALERVFADLVEATPKRVLKFSRLNEAFVAMLRLAEQGVAVDRLAECARRMGEDADFRSRRFPPALETWLGEGQYLGWWPEAAPTLGEPAQVVSGLPAHAAPEADQAVWAVVRQQLVMTLSEAEFGSYLRPAFLGASGGQVFVVAATGVGREWIKRACWRRLCGWWAEADAGKRPLSLVSRHEFEAGLARQSEGV